MASSAASWRDSLTDYKFSYLLLALLVLVLTPLVVGEAVTRSLTFGLTFLGVLIFGFLAVARHRKLRVVAMILGLVGVLAQVTTFVFGEAFYPQLRMGVFTVFLVFLVVVIVKDVLTAEAVTWDKIQGAVCAYLLIGLTWGVIFHWVAIRDPAAFAGAVQTSGDAAFDSLMYFSFVTLTTLGYGDITPVSHSARTLAWLEAGFGQIYLTVLVARLVGLHLTHSARGES